VELKQDSESEEEEVLDQKLEEVQKEEWETGTGKDEDEDSEVDEDTLIDFGYAVGKPPITNKSLTLNTRSPTAKITLSHRLDTPNVRHPLSHRTAPADGSSTHGPPSLPLRQAESHNLYNGNNNNNLTFIIRLENAMQT